MSWFLYEKMVLVWRKFASIFLSCYCSSRQYFYILATSFVPVVTRQGRGGANGRNRQLCSAQKIWFCRQKVVLKLLKFTVKPSVSSHPFNKHTVFLLRFTTWVAVLHCNSIMKVQERKLEYNWAEERLFLRVLQIRIRQVVFFRKLSSGTFFKKP